MISSLTSLGAFLVHDAVAALTALDRVLGLDQVVRAAICGAIGVYIGQKGNGLSTAV